MKLNKIKLYLYQLIYSQIKHTKIMTQNMRSPGKGFLGNVARELMIIFNEFVSQVSKSLHIKIQYLHDYSCECLHEELHK